MGREEGKKYDKGKERWDLVPYDALEEVVKVYTLGAEKYGERNWEKGISYTRIFAAVMRHIVAWWNGEDADSESGLSHLAHAAWGMLALLYYEKHRKEFDDRSVGRTVKR